jgi:hypothetical protein
MRGLGGFGTLYITTSLDTFFLLEDFMHIGSYGFCLGLSDVEVC